MLAQHVITHTRSAHGAGGVLLDVSGMMIMWAFWSL